MRETVARNRFGERVFGPGDHDLRLADDDFRHECAEVSLFQINRRLGEEALQARRGDLRLIDADRRQRLFDLVVLPPETDPDGMRIFGHISDEGGMCRCRRNDFQTNKSPSP